MSKKMMRKFSREEKIIYNAFLISVWLVIVFIITVMSYSIYNTGKNSNIFEEKTKELNEISKALEEYQKQNWFYPSPEKTIWILAGKWNHLLYQGYASKWLTQDRLKLTDIKYEDYIYTITKNGSKYQLFAFCPDGKLISKWNKLWIFVDKDNVPFQDLKDAPNNIVNTDKVFYVYFDDTIKITGSDRKLTPIMYISEYEYDPDLIGYWNMETTFKDKNTWDEFLYDISGNKHHGIIDAKMPIWTEDWVVGKASIFSGTMQNIAFLEFTKTMNTEDNYTFSFYFKDAVNAKELNTVIWIWSWVRVKNPHLRIATNNIKNIADYDNGRWHLWVVTIDRSTAKVEFYVDGKKVETKFPAGDLDFDTATQMSIWYNWYLNDYFKGQLDEVRIYKKLLSQEEIDELYSKIKVEENTEK